MTQRTKNDGEETLLRRAASWPAHPSWRSLTVGALQDVAAHEGIDFATALLYDRIVRSREHGPFIQRVVSSIDDESSIGSAPKLALVPGACYREYPQTGADGGRLREAAGQCGLSIETIPIASLGPISQNAQTIGDWLQNHATSDTAIVSLSKGGADIKRALDAPGASELFWNVRLWISLSGILFGTPAAGWFLRRPIWRLILRVLCWRHGLAFSVLRELDRSPTGPLAGELQIPDGLIAVHVVGFPLECHLSSRRAKLGHRRLAPMGPNDGGSILLGDLTRLPGLIFPVWGADHYLDPLRDIRPLIRRILLEGIQLATKTPRSSESSFSERGDDEPSWHPDETAADVATLSR
jgi:hypothetical protein